MNDPLVSKKRNMSSATRHPIIKKRKNGDNTSFVSIPPEMLVMIAQKVDRGTSVNLRTVNRLFKSVTTFVHGSQRLTDIWKLISQMALTSQNQNYDRIWIHNRSARDQIFNLDCAYIAVLSASIVGNIRFAKWALDRLVFPGAVADAHIPIVFAVAGGHSEFIKFWIQLNTLSDATNRKRHVLRRAVLRFNQTSLIPLMGLDDEQDVSKVEGYLCLAMTNCSTQFVHNLLWNLSSFLARTGTPNFTFGRKVVNIDRTKIWSRSFKLDLETFKTLDKFAYLPRVKKEKHLRLLLSSGNKEIFEYLKNRIELSQQWDKCQLLHGAVTGDEPSILEWLTERGITACTMEILNTCLGLALRFNKQRTFSWIVENMQRICPVATQWPLPVNELTLKLVDAMLCVDGTYSYAQMDEFAQKLFGRDIKATLSSNMISISTTTYSLAAVREEPDILQILTDAGKISADDHALMAHAVLHKRFKVVDWLKNNDFPVDWKTMAAVVCTGTYEEIRNMQLNYSKDDLFNWRVTALAARRGDIDILKLLWDFGYPFISSVFLEALTSGSSTCIQWMGKTVPECITISSSFICKCISVVQLTDGTVGTFTRWFLNWLTTFVISKRNHVVDIHEYNHILNLISAEDRTLPRYVTESTCTLYHSNEDPLYQLNQPLNNIMPLNIGMVTKLMERQKWAFHVCGKQAQLIVDNWMKPFLQ